MLEKDIKKQVDEKEKKIQWWQLSLIGGGTIIGAGFFLGTGLSIQLAGPSIIFAYLLGGITAFLVFNALAEMSVHDPSPGSFRTYAKKAFGSGMGFMSGWIYWLAGIFIMSSEITALSIFTQFWYPYFPLWAFSVMYALLGFGINFMGVSNLGKIEAVFALVKMTSLLIFVGIALLLLTGIIPHMNTSAGLIHASMISYHTWFPNHLSGMWTAMLFVLFSFGGIEIIGIASNELKEKNKIFRAGNVLLLSLTALYILSIFMVIALVSWKHISSASSPFVTALHAFTLPYMGSLFNLIIISAAFSTMVGTLYSISRIMISLAQDGDAPHQLAKKNSRGAAAGALLLSGFGLAFAILLSYLLPKTVYVFITTAAGILLILNWIIILSSQLKLHYAAKRAGQTFPLRMAGFPYTSWVGIILIAAAITGSLVHNEERVGFLISMAMVAAVLLGYLILSRRRQSQPEPSDDSKQVFAWASKLAKSMAEKEKAR